MAHLIYIYLRTTLYGSPSMDHQVEPRYIDAAGFVADSRARHQLSLGSRPPRIHGERASRSDVELSARTQDKGLERNTTRQSAWLIILRVPGRLRDHQPDTTMRRQYNSSISKYLTSYFDPCATLLALYSRKRDPGPPAIYSRIPVADTVDRQGLLLFMTYHWQTVHRVQEGEAGVPSEVAEERLSRMQYDHAAKNGSPNPGGARADRVSGSGGLSGRGAW
ncbi:hypothetical protein K438DRAFT_1772850 [Mycena galopus ATCC 62051]|nr:hypothetical protein K438DRAFT_1772850 [Mycena galopus ATCC 62051]